MAHQSTGACWSKTTWRPPKVVSGGTVTAYAPELNPVEYMWGHLKTHRFHVVATQAWELSFEATAALRRMRRRRLIITACYTQAELWP